jgi:hypothetical protein
MAIMNNEPAFQKLLKYCCERAISVAQVIRERKAEYKANLDAEENVVSGT